MKLGVLAVLGLVPVCCTLYGVRTRRSSLLPGHDDHNDHDDHFLDHAHLVSAESAKLRVKSTSISTLSLFRGLNHKILAIMLNPFRIRNLYFDSTATDLIDLSGVVQLSAQQYDQEIQAFPETALAYLDEDDGETVTVSYLIGPALPDAYRMLRSGLLLNSSNGYQNHREDTQVGRPT